MAREAGPSDAPPQPSILTLPNGARIPCVNGVIQLPMSDKIPLTSFSNPQHKFDIQPLRSLPEAAIAYDVSLIKLSLTNVKPNFMPLARCILLFVDTQMADKFPETLDTLSRLNLTVLASAYLAATAGTVILDQTAGIHSSISLFEWDNLNKSLGLGADILNGYLSTVSAFIREQWPLNVLYPFLTYLNSFRQGTARVDDAVLSQGFGRTGSPPCLKIGLSKDKYTRYFLPQTWYGKRCEIKLCNYFGNVMDEFSQAGGFQYWVPPANENDPCMRMMWIMKPHVPCNNPYRFASYAGHILDALDKALDRKTNIIAFDKIKLDISDYTADQYDNGVKNSPMNSILMMVAQGMAEAYHKGVNETTWLWSMLSKEAGYAEDDVPHADGPTAGLGLLNTANPETLKTFNEEVSVSFKLKWNCHAYHEFGKDEMRSFGPFEVRGINPYAIHENFKKMFPLMTDELNVRNNPNYPIPSFLQPILQSYHPKQFSNQPPYDHPPPTQNYQQ